MGKSVRATIEDVRELDKLASQIAKNHPDEARRLRGKSGKMLSKAVSRIGRKVGGKSKTASVPRY